MIKNLLWAEFDARTGVTTLLNIACLQELLRRGVTHFVVSACEWDGEVMDPVTFAPLPELPTIRNLSEEYPMRWN